MSTWVKQTREILLNRKTLAPTDLPPFGALVKTADGHTVELIGWFDRNPQENSTFADQRIAFGLFVDGAVCPDVPFGGMVFGYFTESSVVSAEPQIYPKFGRYLVDLFLTEQPAPTT